MIDTGFHCKEPNDADASTSLFLKYCALLIGAESVFAMIFTAIANCFLKLFYYYYYSPTRSSSNMQLCIKINCGLIFEN